MRDSFSKRLISFAKKATKKLAKNALKAIVRLFMMLGRAVKFFLGIFGIPGCLVGCFSIIIVILVSVLITMILGFFASLLGFGDLFEGLDEDTINTQEYISQKADESIDPNKPEQIPFRLHESIIATAMQLDMYEQDVEEDEKEIIDDLAEKLKPEFKYEEFIPKIKVLEISCENDNCEEVETIEDGDPIQLLTQVDTWDGVHKIFYDRKWGQAELIERENWQEEETIEMLLSEAGDLSQYDDYEIFVKFEEKEITEIEWVNGEPRPVRRIITVPVNYVRVTTIVYYSELKLNQYEDFIAHTAMNYDYSKLEEVLFGYGYSRGDIQWLEAIYEDAGGEIYYTSWAIQEGYITPDGDVVDDPNYVPGNLPPLPPIDEGHYTAPTTGRITSGYGYRSGGMHHGIDIGKGGRSRVAVVAIADGIVTRSYYSNSYGNVVFISHNLNGQRYETVYAHLEYRSVSEGERVEKGQFIGEMGNTGHSYGAHLHFEIHSPSWNLNKTNSFNPLSNNQGIIIRIPPQ